MPLVFIFFRTTNQKRTEVRHMFMADLCISKTRFRLRLCAGILPDWLSLQFLQALPNGRQHERVRTGILMFFQLPNSNNHALLEFLR